MRRSEGNSLGSVLFSDLLQGLWDRTLSLAHILFFSVPKFSYFTYARLNFQTSKGPKHSSSDVTALASLRAASVRATRAQAAGTAESRRFSQILQSLEGPGLL